MKIVPIDSGSGPVIPTDQTITSGEYTPLSRPLFIYVNTEPLERAEVKAFVKFYMENGEQLVAEVGYTPLPPSVYQENLSVINQLP
jgi:phosphate transport system substrate-binding protein